MNIFDKFYIACNSGNTSDATLLLQTDYNVNVPHGDTLLHTTAMFPAVDSSVTALLRY